MLRKDYTDSYYVPLMIDPSTGELLQEKYTYRSYKDTHPLAVWRYDPWIGQKRKESEIAEDPFGDNVRHYGMYVGALSSEDKQ